MTEIKIILFNGPPGSGKDTAANIARDILFLEKGIRPHLLKFAEPLKKCTHEAYGIPDVEADFYEKTKNDPSEDFFGLSPREAYIKMSEKCIKPGIDREFFGKVAHKSLKDKIIMGKTNVFLISDSGFVEETKQITEEFKDVFVVHLYRDGHDFKNDSRDYIVLPGFNHYTIHNKNLLNFAEDINNFLFKEVL